MLSYQHAYHAGNHADILKHYVLTFVLNSLNKKEKPYTFFDTHAGSGLYDLLDNRSQKTLEAVNGVQKLIHLADLEIEKLTAASSAFGDYLRNIKKYTDKMMYPGSPELERTMLRQQDFLMLSELHPQEIENLRNNIQSSPFSDAECKNIQIHKRNGFEMLKALTPPATKRGAVLIDPSYEESEDYEEVAKTVIQVHKKWSNGIIMVWYPLLAHRQSEIDLMIERITEAAKLQNQNIEIADIQLLVNSKDSHIEVSLEEFAESKKNPPRLYGSGMLVLNSPWRLLEEGKLISEQLSYFLGNL